MAGFPMRRRHQAIWSRVGHQALLAAEIAVAEGDAGGETRSLAIEPGGEGKHLGLVGGEEGFGAVLVLRDAEERGALGEIGEEAAEHLLMGAGGLGGAAAAVVGEGGGEIEFGARVGETGGEETGGLGGIDLAGEAEQFVEREEAGDLGEGAGIERDGVERGALAIAGPDVVLLGLLEQGGIGGDAEAGAVLADELEAEGMDRAEECLSEAREEIAPADIGAGAQEKGAGADAQLLGGGVGVGDDDETGEVRRVAAGKLRDAADDGGGLANAGAGGDAEIGIEVRLEPVARGLIVKAGGSCRGGSGG